MVRSRSGETSPRRMASAATPLPTARQTSVRWPSHRSMRMYAPRRQRDWNWWNGKPWYVCTIRSTWAREAAMRPSAPPFALCVCTTSNRPSRSCSLRIRRAAASLRGEISGTSAGTRAPPSPAAYASASRSPAGASLTASRPVRTSSVRSIAWPLAPVPPVRMTTAYRSGFSASAPRSATPPAPAVNRVITVATRIRRWVMRHLPQPTGSEGAQRPSRTVGYREVDKAHDPRDRRERQLVQSCQYLPAQLGRGHRVARRVRRPVPGGEREGGREGPVPAQLAGGVRAGDQDPRRLFGFDRGDLGARPALQYDQPVRAQLVHPPGQRPLHPAMRGTGA